MYDLKVANKVIKKVLQQGKSQSTVAHELVCSRTFVQAALKRWFTYGSAAAEGSKGIRHGDRRMTPVMMTLLRKLVDEDDSRTLSEYAASLRQQSGKQVSGLGISRAFHELGLTRKIRTKHNSNADPAQQQAYQEIVWQRYEYDQFLFSDEAGFTRKTNTGYTRCY